MTVKAVDPFAQVTVKAVLSAVEEKSTEMGLGLKSKKIAEVNVVSKKQTPLERDILTGETHEIANAEVTSYDKKAMRSQDA